jgi:hypothetical protein
LTFSGSGSPPYEGEINANFLYGVQIEPYAPTVGQVLTAISTSAANWQTPTGGSGNVSSVFGRTGAVVAVSGDYTVAQVTGAAPLVSPSFTTPALGTASSGVLSACTTATQAPLANNTDLASCAYVDNIAFGVGSAVLREDFINAGYNSSVSTGAGGIRFYSDETWSVISVGGAGLAEPQASTFANPGQIIMTTAATTAYGVALYAGTGYNCCGVLGSNAPWQLDFIIKLSQTATCCFRGGFCISTFVMTSAAPTDGIYVEYDTGNTGNTATDFTWVTAKASSYSYSTTNAIAVDATNWHHFRIRSTVAGTVGFTVDGGTEFTTTSDVPTTASGMAPFFQIVSRQASTAKSLQMDFVGYQAATGRT